MEDRDIYGFPLDLTPAQQQQRIHCAKAEAASERKWKSLEAKKRLPPKNALKDLVRKGVPVHLRPWVWAEVSGAAALQASCGPSYYNDMVTRGYSAPCVRQIELDLPRTFPAQQWLQSPEGQEMLRRVLLAFAGRNPVIGYCQSMNYLAGFLLLVTRLQEEKAFYLMAALVENIVFPATYSSNLAGCHVEMRALGSLLKIKLPRLSTHLDKLGADISIISTDWFLCLFATTFPAETVARIWDSLLLEGGKVLFRVAIAFLHTHQTTLLSYDNAGELLKGLKDAGRGLHEREALLQWAFKRVGPFPLERINALRGSHKQAVDDMVAEREARKRRQELKEAISSARQVHQEAAGGPAGQGPPQGDAAPSTAAEISKTLSAGITALSTTVSSTVMPALSSAFSRVSSAAGGAAAGAAPSGRTTK